MKEFIMKQRLILLAIGTLIFISFQNCSKSGFNTQDLASSIDQSSSSIKTCTASTLSCETDSGYGQQTCTNNPIGNALLGPCVISSCKTGYSFVSGACISNNCTPGTQISCDLTNGTGTRICDQTGQYGVCSNPVCNAGFYLTQSNVCAPEFVQVLVNSANEFTAVINNIYDFNITTSPGAVLNDATSSLTAISGSCPANRSWAPLNKALKPWTLDGTSIGTQLKIGSNSWNFSGSFAQDMLGCQWSGCVDTTTGASNCITIDTTCPAGKYFIGASCGVCLTNTTYNATTKSCDPIPTPGPVTTIPTTSTTTMTTTTTTTTTVKMTTTTTTLKPTTTTTTLPPSTTTTTLSTTCTFNGQILQYGQSVTAYSVTTAYTPGDNCVFHQQVRTCYGNNNLVGTFPYASCTNIASSTTTTTLPPPITTSTTTTLPSTCSFNGQTVQYGQSVLAYEYQVAPAGVLCIPTSEYRICGVGGVLSGTYQYSSCTNGAPPPPCPAGQQHVVNSKGISVCAVQCNYQTGLIPNYLYKCSNGVSVTIVNTSSCQSGGTNYAWPNVYLTYVPSSSVTYTCTAGNVFPY